MGQERGHSVVGSFAQPHKAGIIVLARPRSPAEARLGKDLFPTLVQIVDRIHFLAAVSEGPDFLLATGCLQLLEATHNSRPQDLLHGQFTMRLFASSEWAQDTRSDPLR